MGACADERVPEGDMGQGPRDADGTDKNQAGDQKSQAVRFVYQYRTHDNAVRSGEVSAADRDAAYRALKEKGIRPSRLEEAPGLANKIFGKGKRWIASRCRGRLRVPGEKSAVRGGGWQLGSAPPDIRRPCDDGGLRARRLRFRLAARGR